MPRLCYICKCTKNCEYETFIVNGAPIHYCVDHINDRPSNGVRLPCTLDLQTSDSKDINDIYKYSGRCKVCVKIGHDNCMGCFPRPFLK